MPERPVQVRCRDWWKKRWKNRTLVVEKGVGVLLVKGRGTGKEKADCVPFDNIVGISGYEVKQEESVLVDGEYRYGHIGVYITTVKGGNWAVATGDTEDAEELINLLYSFEPEMRYLTTTSPTLESRSPLASLSTSFSSRCNLSTSDHASLSPSASPRNSRPFLSPPSSVAGSPLLGFSPSLRTTQIEPLLGNPTHAISLATPSPLSSPKPERTRVATTLTSYSPERRASHPARLVPSNNVSPLLSELL
eukprot:TRINITY_DN23458_c0_g1_i1.p1 TRINITY_DN23458_c0_g1~~TRINITY_DN23458_c0_g1_i1.p1  ORF type:complete len:249 (+),score=9.39 TRINITY_DN23458_c0_g1_i1:279-1025(+)